MTEAINRLTAALSDRYTIERELGLASRNEMTRDAEQSATLLLT